MITALDFLTADLIIMIIIIMIICYYYYDNVTSVQDWAQRQWDKRQNSNPTPSQIDANKNNTLQNSPHPPNSQLVQHILLAGMLV